MNKRQAEPTRYVGIDVGARQLVVAIGQAGMAMAMHEYANSAAGHQQLRQRLQQLGGVVRIAMEASGTYSLDVALVLAGMGERVQLEMVNPRRARRFAESLGQRSKTDPVDARALCQYAQRMPMLRWQPPSIAALRLRAVSRTIAALVGMCTQHKNRQHALSASAALPVCLVRELEAQVRYTEKRIAKLRREAIKLIASQPELAARFQHLLSLPGVGEASAVALLGELAVLPECLDERQWVAHAGLDPKHHQSGTSVAQKPSISKAGNRYLRSALFMPALVAVQYDPAMGGFYQRLLDHGKAKLQALVAVMRKLLHAAWGMFRTDQDYNGAKLCPSV